MLAAPNALQWDGGPGHYEVYYVTLTDPATGVGAWIRYTMLAPVPTSGQPATAALWFLAMDPRPGAAPTIGRKVTFPVTELHAQPAPFELRIDSARLTDDGMAGAVGDVALDLHWSPCHHAYEHVHPVLRRAGVAKTVLVLPHADIAIHGTISFAGRKLELAGARGGQAHLWGSKHARSWAWVHCNDFSTLEGEPVPGAFVDGVSVIVPRLGREMGPARPWSARSTALTSTPPRRCGCSATTARSLSPGGASRRLTEPAS